MAILTVNNLCKDYPSFQLKDISFSLEAGRIVGFIGRNGAGKTTTIKSLLNLIHPSGGTITYFGASFTENEAAVKQRIGYSTGSISWYPRKKLKDLVAVIRGFYPNWDEAAYRKYLDLFQLDENKCPKEFSEGMKVKCNLLIALSHKAELLILDEPTSGLDPFARDELLDVFEELKKDGVAVFYSTHIISDLEKCADDILYISQGQIRAFLPKDTFIQTHGNENETLEEIILRLEKEDRHA